MAAASFALVALPHYPQFGVVVLGVSVVAYRAGESEFARKLSEGVYTRRATRYDGSTTESKGTIMSDWYARNQEATLVVADAHREPWTPEDVDFVIEMTDDATDVEIALSLGRTLHAVADLQWRVRREGVEAVRAGYAPRVRSDAARVAAAPTYDFVTTFPVGWND